MNPKNAALVVSIVGSVVTVAGGCLDLKTTNPGTTGGQGGSAGNGQGGAAGEASSSSSGSSSASSSSGMGSSSSSSSGGSCTPGNTMSCYPGPADTQFKGKCKAGKMTCDAGMWSGCMDVVLPILEPCNSVDDINCDGRTGCKGIPDNSSITGKNEDDSITSIAIGTGTNGFDGAVYGAGYRNAVAAVDGTPDSAEVLFVKRDSMQVLTDWSDRFSIDPLGHAWAKGIAVSPKEDILVVGTYQNGSLNVGNQGLKAANSSSLGFFASFDAMGTMQFAKSLGVDGDTVINTVGVDSSGNIYIGGKYSGSIDFGGTSIVAAGGFDGFVASFTSNGTFRWKQVWSGSGDQSVEKLSVDTTGTVYVGSPFGTTITIGGNAFPSDGGADSLVTAIDPANGNPKWYNQIGGTGDAFITDIASHGGNIALIVGFRGSLGLGPATHQSMDMSPFFDGAVATLESGGGAILATYPFIAGGFQVPEGVAIDSFGDVVVTGFFTNKLPLGGGLDLSSSLNDINAFVVKFDKDLAPIWGHGYGNSPVQAFGDVAIEPTNGHTFIGGGFQGILSGFGLQPPQSIGGIDAVIGSMSN